MLEYFGNVLTFGLSLLSAMFTAWLSWILLRSDKVFWVKAIFLLAAVWACMVNVLILYFTGDKLCAYYTPCARLLY